MNPKVALAIVLAIGAALRFWHIGAGLPYRVGPDEPVIAERAIHIMRSGNFHPRFFDYPSLYIYVQLLIACATYMGGAMSGSWQAVTAFHPEHLFMWSRVVNAALGTLTLACLYPIGAIWGKWVGVAAAGILAFWPNHVRESHFALTDVPLTFLVVVTAWLALRAADTEKHSWFLLAGVCAGLSAATKYNGALAMVMPLVAAAMMQRPLARRATAAAVVAASASLAFLAAAPYTILDLPGFLNAFGRLSIYYGPRPFAEGARIYLLHGWAAVGWAALILSAVGLAWGTAHAVREHDLRRWVPVVVFSIAYFYTIATKQLIFARYLLPIIPFICLFMAITLVRLLPIIWALRRPLWVRGAAGAALVGVTLFPLVRAGIAWPAAHGRRGTVDVAYEQILESIPKGAGVAVERSVLRLPTTMYKKMDVHRFTERTEEDYKARGTTYVVASSAAFGPAFDAPSEHAADYARYQALFNNVGHCLPAIEPTASVPGPRIVICRLDAPILPR